MFTTLFNIVNEKAFKIHRSLYERSNLIRFATHAYRIIYQFGVAVFVVAPLLIVGTPTLAVGLLFVDKHAKVLPKWLKWFDNADEDGLTGDNANRQRNITRGIDPDGYLAKLLWLGFRNNLNYFKYRILGVKVSDIRCHIAVVEKTDVQGEQFVGDYHSSGRRFIEVELKNGARRYEYYIIWPYHLPLVKKPLCFRARLGWKIGHPDEPNKPRTYYSWSCTVNPVCSYRGKWPAPAQLQLGERCRDATSSEFSKQAEKLKKDLASRLSIDDRSLPSTAEGVYHQFGQKLSPTLALTSANNELENDSNKAHQNRSKVISR